ncbi:hypothetical protein HXX76_010221 [Chlamydomonas incerta]|uniref:Uncharacterized protein n=1 Tax=Chlamydomonas incerta TaxID=51695 RepID=A0A835VUS9_CHLIN|nr:hypothetical protein HXX76_010221 [Chlamydomonas incerta]|eukprot:KAG2430122.1 hypothetical protein HXX76_010221 [Chlamydomonas incerta]
MATTLGDVLGGVLALAYTVTSVPFVIMSPMIFDAPGSTQSALTRLLFITVVAGPVCGGVSTFLAVSRLLYMWSWTAPAPSAAPLASFGRELLVVLTPVLGQLAAVGVAMALLQVLQGGNFGVDDRSSRPPSSSAAARERDTTDEGQP